MAIYELDGVAPQVAASAWVADSAQVIGDVVLVALVKSVNI
jgi:carbonic anhydrase/acetyltransferase-like protein (isoleucine patch superfamily)